MVEGRWQGFAWITSRAMQPPWPRLGVMGCMASPTTVMQPCPKALLGFSHLQGSSTFGHGLVSCNELHDDALLYPHASTMYTKLIYNMHRLWITCLGTCNIQMHSSSVHRALSMPSMALKSDRLQAKG